MNDSEFDNLSDAPLVAYENRMFRALMLQMERERWLKKRLKVLWPYVVAVMGGIVWSFDTLYKFFKH